MFYSGETKYHRNGVGFMIHNWPAIWIKSIIVTIPKKVISKNAITIVLFV